MTLSAPFSRRKVASACTCAGGQCSVSMPDEVGPPNGAATPKRSRASPAAHRCSRRSACAPRGRRARAPAPAMRSSTMRASLALAPRPIRRRARRDQVGLRAQDHAVVDHLERVGGERRAGRGDVDDQLGGAGRRRAFGRARAFDDAVVGDAVLREKSRVRFTYLVASRILRSCLSRNAVATSSRSAMLCTSIQACGTATTTLAWPKPSVVDQHDLAVGVGDHLADQVLAGDAEMHRALRRACCVISAAER